MEKGSVHLQGGLTSGLRAVPPATAAPAHAVLCIPRTCSSGVNEALALPQLPFPSFSASGSWAASEPTCLKLPLILGFCVCFSH